MNGLFAEAIASLARRSCALVACPMPWQPPTIQGDYTVANDLRREDNFRLTIPPDQDRSDLDADGWGAYVAALGRAYADALGLDVCTVRLGQTSHDECRLFHCDHVRVRLFQTLRGPGTEYLSEDNVRRDGLGRGRNDLIVRDPTRIHRVPEGMIFLMRGERSTPGAGVVHRSPAIAHTGITRIYLSLDEGFSS